jgi:hypothetical protein
MTSLLFIVATEPLIAPGCPSAGAVNEPTSQVVQLGALLITIASGV